jgi:aryl-alcohol dehydrogenase-like predicted oxidoreductase
MTIENRKLGATGPSVFPLALGCMGMTGVYGAHDANEAIATIHMAIERGITLFDTGDFYDMGKNELLIARALAGGKRDKVLLSVKFGSLRAPDGMWIGFDGRPSSVKNFLAQTLSKLGTDHVDIYRPSRVDPTVPMEDTIGAIVEMVKRGWVRHIGLSELGADTIRRVHKIHPITDLQIEYSLVSRKPEDKIFPTLAELDIGATLYGVLSRGLLSGAKPAAGDFRARMPRFAGDNLGKNQRLVEELQTRAKARGVTAAQLCIAWAFRKQPRLIPVVGARTRQQLSDALAAVEIELSPSEIAELEAVVNPDAVAGTRYDAHQMQHLDSEK